MKKLRLMQNTVSCKRCVLPDTYPRISIDRRGVCSFCRFYESHGRDLEDWEKLSLLYDKRLNMYSKGGKIRCLVAFSGGKDSSYLLFILSQDPRLKIVAYTLDNLFMYECTKSNIASVCNKLRIEHVFIKPSFPQPNVYKSFLKKYGLFCPACWIPVISEGFRLAHREGISLVFSAMSSPQLLSNLLHPHDHQGLWHYNRRAWVAYWFSTWERILNILRNAVGRDRDCEESFLFPHPEYSPELFDSIPDCLYYFAFHDYREDRIVREIMRSLQWTEPCEYAPLKHTDCIAHDLSELLLLQTLPYHPKVGELSVLVREGKMNREKALSIALDTENYLDLSNIDKVQEILKTQSLDELIAYGRNAKPTKYVHYW